MSIATTTRARKPVLLDRFRRPGPVIALILLIWLPLSAHVLVGRRLGWMQDHVLLVALPALLVLYVVAARAWRESPVAIIGLSFVFFWLLMAVTAPHLPLIDPNRPIAPFQLPGATVGEFTFWLGSDMRGRDILSRTIWGSQRILVWGVSATLCAYVIGTVFGLVAGYLSGWWDEVISFLSNVLLSFPVMVMLILVMNFLGQSGVNIIIAVTFASAPAIMRIVRGLTLDLKTRDYIQAARTRGERLPYIMFIEVLPNVRGPLIVDACLRLGYTTVAITTLTFLGLGLQPPDPDWGLMIREASSSALLWQFSYMLIVPALSVSTLILGFNLMADGLREMSLKD